MKRVFGHFAKPMRQKDYLLNVPAYKYNLPCGHHAFYRVRLDLNGFGYCHDCREYFVNDPMRVPEVPPHNRRGRLSVDPEKCDDKLSRLVDDALIRNRIADNLDAMNIYQLADDGSSNSDVVDTAITETVAKAAGATIETVRQVARDVGYDYTRKTLRRAQPN